MPTASPIALPSRARWLLVSMDGMFGVMVASWLARIPTVRDLCGLSTGEVGAFRLVGLAELAPALSVETLAGTSAR